MGDLGGHVPHRTISSGRSAKHGALALAVALIQACSRDKLPTESQGARDSAVEFQTDSLAYTLHAGVIGYNASLVVVYTNRATSTAYFDNCRGATGLTFEKLVGSEWQVAWSPFTLLCYSPPIVVPPRGTHVFHIEVFGGYPDCQCGPRFLTPDIPGIYRAVWSVGFPTDPASSSVTGGPLTLVRRVSNQFMLSVSPR